MTVLKNDWSSSHRPTLGEYRKRAYVANGWNFSPITDTITLNGQTGVTTNVDFYRITLVQVLTAGSAEKNEGNIYIGEGTLTAGKPATVYNLIHTGCNRSHCAATTTPKGYSSYMVYGVASSSTPAMITQLVRPAGGVFYASGSTVINGSQAFQLKGSPGLDPGTDYQIQVKTLSGTGIVTFYAEFIEIDQRSG